MKVDQASIRNVRCRALLTTVGATAEALVRDGMTTAQASVYVTLPIWLPVVFAIRVFGAGAGRVVLLVL